MKPKISEVDAKFSLISLLKEVARKSIHISACGVALILIANDFKVLEYLFLPAMALGFYISEKIEFFGKNISFGNRRKWGGILLAVGLSLVMFAPVEYEVKKFSILTLMIADVMAALIGKIAPIRKVEVLGAYKSIGGSAAFIVGLIIALKLSFGSVVDLGFLRVTTSLPALVALEFLNWRGIDNVTLPLATMILGQALFT
jgi:dolichol kinase